MIMGDSIEKEFLSCYQSIRPKENSNDLFTEAIFKKSRALLSLSYASKTLGNATTCHIFEDQLKEYFDLVDDRNGINNFAKATLDLMSNVKNASKSWSSGLPESINSIPWQPLKGECHIPTEEGLCGNALPPPSAIEEFRKAQLPPSKIKAPLSTSTVQTTLDQYASAPCSSSKGNTGYQRKSSLYSSYDDNTEKNLKKAPSEYQRSSTYIEENRKKRSLYSTYSDSNNLQLKASVPDMSKKHGRQFEWKGKKKNTFKSNYSETDAEETTAKSGIYHQFPGGKGYARNSKPIFTCGFQNNTSDNEEGEDKMEVENHFTTAKQQLVISNQKRFGNQRGGRMDPDQGGGHDRSAGFQPHVAIKKSLGGKRSVSSKFVPPVKNNSQEEDYKQKDSFDPETELDERLKNIEPRMVELIRNEIMDSGSKVDWDDIAGLNFAKSTIQEIVVWPMLRPDIFTGLRRPPKGILLFGPPGTGKTLIGKCIASQSNSTFFSISASSLTSKWIGEGEKMVRALFAVARCHQPAVVFIDEIDSLLSQRSDTEHESSRRIKTEFLVQLDGAATGEDDRILVIGATNRPQELDEAARRRLVKRLYIPLPDKEARKQLVQNLIKIERNDLTSSDTDEISCLTDGYSGADMKNLCQEASLGPIRSISSKDMFQISAEQVRPVNISDFKMALKRVKSSVSSQDLEIYVNWDQQYGSGACS